MKSCTQVVTAGPFTTAPSRNVPNVHRLMIDTLVRMLLGNKKAHTSGILSDTDTPLSRHAESLTPTREGPLSHDSVLVAVIPALMGWIIRKP